MRRPDFSEGSPEVNVTARRARRPVDARSHARQRRQAHGRRLHRKEAAGRRRAVQRRAQRRHLHRRRSHQRGDHPERAVVAASASPACRPPKRANWRCCCVPARWLLRRRIVEQRSVGPSLGAGQHRARLRAMAIGLVLTFAFMAIYYRAFGWIANAGAAANLVLTVGLAVDAAGVAVAARHRGGRVPPGYRGRREHPHLRAHPRRAALRQLAAGRRSTPASRKPSRRSPTRTSRR